MKILVIGAAGRTGRLVVEQALGHGQEVRAFEHVTGIGLSHSRLERVTGDVLVFEDVEPAVAGCDAVVFAVGSSGGRDLRLHSEGVANVLHAMAVHDVGRLAAMSAAGAFARNDPRIGLGFRAMIATVLKPVYDDLERMEQRIAASGVEWTIVRPSGLSDGEQTGDYRLSLDGSLLRKAARVSRADVAALLLKSVESGAFPRRTIAIAG